MNSDASVWEQLFSGWARPLVSRVLIAGVAVTAALPVRAQEGVLVFHGQLVNSTCALNEPAHGVASQPVFSVQVQPGIFLDVDTQHNACTGAVVPFTTRYQSVPQAPVNSAQATQSLSSSALGVITVTYQ